MGGGEGDIYVKISSIPIFVIYALRGQCILLVSVVFFFQRINISKIKYIHVASGAI